MWFADTSPIFILCFHSLCTVFGRANVFNFDKVQFINFSVYKFFLLRLCVVSKNALPDVGSWRCSPVFLQHFIGLCFTLIGDPFGGFLVCSLIRFSFFMLGLTDSVIHFEFIVRHEA